MPSYFEKHLFRPLRLTENINPRAQLIVVIPCFNEPDVITTLDSLRVCFPCKNDVEVIVVINAEENCPREVAAQNAQSAADIEKWKTEINPRFPVFVLRDENLPHKHAGVGLARKIGMDEAAFRFEQANNPEGVIVCLDADCTVEKNYLAEIESYFFANTNAKAASIYFEHPLDLPDEKMRADIISYELHLRCYRNALRTSGYPFHHHTIGSSMAVRNEVYQKAGGMNRRKAGEDFYFLHKIMPLGNFGEINKTTVFPSPRISERVPFGTGRAMKNRQPVSEPFTTYNHRIFDELEIFMRAIPLLYGKENEKDFLNGLPGGIRHYLEQENFSEKLTEINTHTSGEQTFRQRFFRWFDGFRMLKAVHYLRDNHYPDIPVSELARTLLAKSNTNPPQSETELLTAFREVDKCAT